MIEQEKIDFIKKYLSKQFPNSPSVVDVNHFYTGDHLFALDINNIRHVIGFKFDFFAHNHPHEIVNQIDKWGLDGYIEAGNRDIKVTTKSILLGEYDEI